MSQKHPIIAVTGSSGVQRGAVREVFDGIFRREGLSAAYVDGEGFHKHDRPAMKEAIAAAAAAGNPHLSHFGPEANLFDRQEELYRTYGETGGGKRRFYLHDRADEAAFQGLYVGAGEFTPWEDVEPATDLMVYEGLHGWLNIDGVNLARHVDLKLGLVPIINMEWIQKIHRDTRVKGFSQEAVVDTILRRMPDYVRYVVPQFRRSDINFQRIPVVDTSNPFIARDVPTPDETLVVIRFRRPEDFPVDFPCLLRHLEGSWMSRRNTIVVPGAKMAFAMQLVLTPIIRRMIEEKRKAG